MSQQGSHIPKFGNWDNDNVPYTAYFENARSEKSIVAPGFNPNDPEDNPEAFMLHQFGGDRQPSANSRPHRLNQSTEKNRRKVNSGVSVDRSNSSNSLADSSRAPRVSERKKNFSLKSRNNPSDDFSYTSASVPKFGEWDDKDPTSGEGFTVIFNKLKEEKHVSASKLPTMQPQNTNLNTNIQKKEKNRRSAAASQGVERGNDTVIYAWHHIKLKAIDYIYLFVFFFWPFVGFLLNVQE